MATHDEEIIKDLIIEQSKDEAVIKKLKDVIAKGGDVDDFKKTLSEIEGLISYISIVSEGDNKKKEKNRLSSLKSWVVLGGIHPDDKNKIKKPAEKRHPDVVKVDNLEKLLEYVAAVKLSTINGIERKNSGIKKEVVKKSDAEKLADLKQEQEKLEAKIALEKLGSAGKRTASFKNITSAKYKTTAGDSGLEKLSTLINHIAVTVKTSELDLVKSLACHKKGVVAKTYSPQFIEINNGLKLNASAKDLIKSFADRKYPAGFDALSATAKSKMKSDLKDAQETEAWLEQLEAISNNSVILF